MYVCLIFIIVIICAAAQSSVILSLFCLYFGFFCYTFLLMFNLLHIIENNKYKNEKQIFIFLVFGKPAFCPYLEYRQWLQFPFF